MGIPVPIGSMYGIYANIWGILMVNVTIYGIHGSNGVGLEDVQSSGFLICFVHRKQIGSWPGSSEKSQALGEQPMQLQYSRAFGAKDVLGDRCLPMLTHTQSGWRFVFAWHSLSYWVSMVSFAKTGTHDQDWTPQRAEASWFSTTMIFGASRW